MYKDSWKMRAAILVLASALPLGACATQEDVTRAQSTADEALQAAKAANQKAEKAEADAAAANARADRMYQQGLKK